MIDAESAQLVNEALDRFAEAMLVELADSDDDELIPIGEMLIEGFKADERGYAYLPELREMTATTAELRERFRVMRGLLAREAA